jgi:tetratricopeptide (TPR) repeat protein
MPQQAKEQKSSAKPEAKITFRVAGKDHTVSYAQALAYAHVLLTEEEHESAKAVLDALKRIRSRDRQVNMMLARCEAGLDNYDACKEILEAVFTGEDKPIAQELQNAFVYWNLGLTAGAIRDIATVVKRHRDLPTACLFLGDLFAQAKKLEKALQCWKLAIKRDRRGGAVAKTARKQIQILTKRRQKKRLRVKKRVGQKS